CWLPLPVPGLITIPFGTGLLAGLTTGTPFIFRQLINRLEPSPVLLLAPDRRPEQTILNRLVMMVAQARPSESSTTIHSTIYMFFTTTTINRHGFGSLDCRRKPRLSGSIHAISLW